MLKDDALIFSQSEQEHLEKLHVMTLITYVDSM